MAKKLKVYEFALSVSYGNGVKLVAAFDRKQAEEMVNKVAELTFDDANWKFVKQRHDILTVKKKPYIILQNEYRE